MMKKTFSWIAAAIAVLMFTGCAKTEPEAGTKPTPAVPSATTQAAPAPTQMEPTLDTNIPDPSVDTSMPQESSSQENPDPSAKMRRHFR